MKSKEEKENPRVFIRADGGSKIGLGHLVRSLALANMISKNFNVRFFSKEIPMKFIDQIVSSGFSFGRIKSEEDFLQVSDEADIIVLDILDLQPSYQEEIKKRDTKLVVIDDLHSGRFSADLIINHAPGVTASDYEADSSTQFALGLDYALLRPAFLREATSKSRTFNNVKKIFICFGGSDNQNLTVRSLEVVLSDPFFESINVVVGNSYGFLEEVKALSASNEKVHLYRDIDEDKMIQVMQDSGLAIVPASGILLEAVTMGLLPITGMYVPNQKFLYQNYKKKEFIIDAVDFSFDAISFALTLAKTKDSERLEVVDGRSGSRILKLFQGLILEDQVDLVLAAPEDLEVTFRWATSPKIRAYAFSQNEIGYEEHKEWFYKKIASREVLFLIAKIDNKPVGSIRFEEINKEPVINYLIDPDYHGKGLGIVILRKGVAILKNRFPSAQKAIGIVMSDNIPSVKIFERLGYNKEVIDNKNYQFTKKL